MYFPFWVSLLFVYFMPLFIVTFFMFVLFFLFGVHQNIRSEKFDHVNEKRMFGLWGKHLVFPLH